MNLKSLFGLSGPLFLLTLLSMLILPIPTPLLDALFTFNIALSLLVLLTAIYSQRPLDFGSFPTVLLLATLLRLALNIASTRVVLLNGHLSENAAGQVIRAFGEVVIGKNTLVGLVVFGIFVVINFIVITKGASRISEVSARFTLEAMPGKQMAIDSDLNAGIINTGEAKLKRSEIGQEADFYGAMDGASKFIRGDAVAGILILGINLLGGSLIGVLQHDQSLIEALQRYALLTIGDGLAAQIPALILSTAAAVMMTRVSHAEDLRQQMMSQILGSRQVVAIAATIMLVLGLVPNMPHGAFLSLGLALGAIAWLMPLSSKKTQGHACRDLPLLEPFQLELGPKLASLLQESESNPLFTRAQTLRKKMSEELGFLLPKLSYRLRTDLDPHQYSIVILGVVTGNSSVYPEKQLAIHPGNLPKTLKGKHHLEPVFGLEALWIEPDSVEHAKRLGYTVVDASTVIATHLSELIPGHAHLWLGHDEVQKLIDRLSETYPKLAADWVPKSMSVGTVTKVLRNLLQEHVPIRDLKTISETLSQMAAVTQDPEILTEYTRVAIGRLLVQQISGFSKVLTAITLSPELEQLLQKSWQPQKQERTTMEPGLAERLQTAIQKYFLQAHEAGENPVLLVTGSIRSLFSRFVRRFLPNARVLSYQEVPQDKYVRVLGTVGNT